VGLGGGLPKPQPQLLPVTQGPLAGEVQAPSLNLDTRRCRPRPAPVARATHSRGHARIPLTRLRQPRRRHRLAGDEGPNPAATPTHKGSSDASAAATTRRRRPALPTRQRPKARGARKLAVESRHRRPERRLRKAPRPQRKRRGGAAATHARGTSHERGGAWCRRAAVRLQAAEPRGEAAQQPRTFPWRSRSKLIFGHASSSVLAQASAYP
jgi:hypothetical protein